jgi:hypothetical protein
VYIRGEESVNIRGEEFVYIRGESPCPSVDKKKGQSLAALPP